MNDPTALLAWLQMHEDTFPSGRSVHSNGVESWLLNNSCASVDEVCSLAITFVKYGFGTLDAVATAHSWAATDCIELIAIDDLLTSYKLSENARTASQACGRQLTNLLFAVNFPGWSPAIEYLNAVRNGEATGNVAIVNGIAQHAFGIAQLEAVLGGIRSAYSGVLTAAVRLGRLGIMRAQQELLLHREELIRLAVAAIQTPLEQIHSAIVELEICGMQHEARSARMFTT